MITSARRACNTNVHELYVINELLVIIQHSRASQNLDTKSLTLEYIPNNIIVHMYVILSNEEAFGPPYSLPTRVGRLSSDSAVSSSYSSCSTQKFSSTLDYAKSDCHHTQVERLWWYLPKVFASRRYLKLKLDML